MVGGAWIDDELRDAERRVEPRVQVRVQQRLVVVDAEARADDEILGVGRPPGEADARREVVPVAEVGRVRYPARAGRDEQAARFRRAVRRFDGEIGHAQLVVPLSDRHVVLVAQPEVQRQAIGHAEIVLEVGAVPSSGTGPS